MGRTDRKTLIRAVREDKGRAQVDLCSRARMLPATLRAADRWGGGPVNEERRRKIAHALGVATKHPGGREGGTAPEALDLAAALRVLLRHPLVRAEVRAIIAEAQPSAAPTPRYHSAQATEELGVTTHAIFAWKPGSGYRP